MEKIETPHNDYHFKYRISAYRKLTSKECEKVVDAYLNLPKHDEPKTDKIIRIDTEIH